MFWNIFVVLLVLWLLGVVSGNVLHGFVHLLLLVAVVMVLLRVINGQRPV